MAGQTPALQQNWQSSEKSQNFREKTQYLMNSLYKNYGDNPATTCAIIIPTAHEYKRSDILRFSFVPCRTAVCIRYANIESTPGILNTEEEEEPIQY